MSETIYLLLGSNEGDRLGQLHSATTLLEARLATGPSAASSIYETAAWGLEDQPSFLNMALRLETELSAAEVLAEVQQVELHYGRQRTVIWGQRTLDVDILFYGDQIIHREDLIVPHPQIAARRFVLVPMAQIAARFRHPLTGITMKEMLRLCNDPLPVTLHNAGA